MWNAERYGAQLNSEELREFDILNYDYEINWHLKNIRTKMSPTSEELKSRSVTVKNRRLAYLDKLVLDGKYFSEDAMREREPYLHHEFVGKFQDPSARGMARPGERWSETLMRRCEEAILVSKIREEQQRLGVDEMEWVGNERNQQQQEEEEEEEEDEDEEEEEHDVEEGNEEAKKVNGGVSSTEVRIWACSLMSNFNYLFLFRVHYYDSSQCTLLIFCALSTFQKLIVIASCCLYVMVISSVPSDL